MVDRATLDGTVSIVTGGGGEVGRGIAAELAAAGSDIAIADVDVVETEYNQHSSEAVGGATRAQEVVDRIEAEGQRARVVECDVTKADQVEAMIDEVIEAFGRIDVLVNNAGVITAAPVEEMAETEWDTVLDVNLKGIFLAARSAIPHLRASGGTIVNTASVAGSTGAAGLAHYCASKHAVLGFTKSLCLELAPEVTVNAVCPGIVRTPMWEEVLTPERGESYEETVDRRIPMERDQTPEDVGRAAVFLAENRNVTGQSIVVDGGMLQRTS